MSTRDPLCACAERSYKPPLRSECSAVLLIVRKGRGSNTRHSAYWANVSKFLKEISIKECKHFNLFPTSYLTYFNQ